jgi:hypothetical protein
MLSDSVGLVTMNYFLLLLILFLCGGGYYEYTVWQTQDAQDVQLAKLDLQRRIDQLQAANTKLEADKADLAKNLKVDADSITDLTAQVQAVQTKLAAAEAAASGKPAVAPAAPSAPAPLSNDLGTIVTLEGKTLPNSQLLKVDPHGITVNSAVGITQVPFTSLPPELQKRFGFDPQSGADLTDAQVQTLEAQREAAAGK